MNFICLKKKFGSSSPDCVTRTVSKQASNIIFVNLSPATNI